MPNDETRAAQARWHNDQAEIWKGWTNWISLDESAKSDAGPPSEPGVYALRARGMVIRRMLGTDEHAVLDIGQSKLLARRLTQLRACASGVRLRGHMAGWRYAYLSLAERLPPHSLEVAWRVGEDCYRLEGATMKAYLDAFGELPPLNYKANWSLLG